MKKFKIIYWVSTGLLSALMLLSAGMYIFNNAEVSKTFEALGYPAYIIYPLAVAKILGLVAIWTRKSKMLTEWAYAGFFYDFVLAFFAHVMVSDGGFAPAMAALLLLATSYFTGKNLSHANC